MGVANTCDLDYFLPNHGNFDVCFETNRDLLKDDSFDNSSCSTDTLYGLVDFVCQNKGKKGCNLVDKNLNRCGKVRKGKILATDAFPEAAGGICPAGPTPAPSTSTCVDSATWFVKKGQKKRCNWVAKNRNVEILEKGKNLQAMHLPSITAALFIIKTHAQEHYYSR
jgi:hypothetical protein